MRGRDGREAWCSLPQVGGVRAPLALLTLGVRLRVLLGPQLLGVTVALRGRGSGARWGHTAACNVIRLYNNPLCGI